MPEKSKFTVNNILFVLYKKLLNNDDGNINFKCPYEKYWNENSFNETIELTDKLFAQHRYLEAYEILNRLKFEKTVEVRWRIAKSLFYLSSNDDIEKNRRKIMLNEALELLENANANAEVNANHQKWLAVILNAKSKFDGLDQIVHNSKRISVLLNKAAELNPTDFTVYYLLGNFNYQLAKMTFFQRFIVKILTYQSGAELANGSISDALRCCRKAEDISPKRFLPNMFILGRIAFDAKKFYSAHYYLNLVQNFQPENDRQMKMNEEAATLIRKLQQQSGTDFLLFGNH